MYERKRADGGCLIAGRLVSGKITVTARITVRRYSLCVLYVYACKYWLMWLSYRAK